MTMHADGDIPSREVLDYALERTWQRKELPLEYAIVSVHNTVTGQDEMLAVPYDVATEPDAAYLQCCTAALYYANALAAASAIWRAPRSDHDTQAEVQAILDEASRVVVENILAVAEERFGPEAKADLIASHRADLSSGAYAPLEARLALADGHLLADEIERRVAMRVARTVRDGTEHTLPVDLDEFLPRFVDGWHQRGEHERQQVRDEFAQGLAEMLLTLRRPSSRRREDLGDLLRSWPTSLQEELTITSLSADAIPLSADTGANRLAQWLAGTLKLRVGADGALSFPEIRKRSYKQVMDVHVDEPPEPDTHLSTGASALVRLMRVEPSEVKAKVLFALLTLAIRHRDHESQRMIVELHTLVSFVSGRQRSGVHRTKSKVYWHTVAVILRYLFIDLPRIRVSVHTDREYELEASTVERVRVVTAPHLTTPYPHDEAALMKHLDAVAQHADTTNGGRDAARFLHTLAPTHVVVGVDKKVLNAFGVYEGAFENVNPDVMRLSGPEFWLAVDVAARRRWSDPKKLGPRHGLRLLELLDTLGFIELSRRRTGNRASYSVALRSFFAAVRKLVALGELDGRGVGLWDTRNAYAPKDATSQVEGWVSARAKRLTEQELAPLKVRYEFRDERFTKLRAARKRAERS